MFTSKPIQGVQSLHSAQFQLELLSTSDKWFYFSYTVGLFIWTIKTKVNLVGRDPIELLWLPCEKQNSMKWHASF